MSRNFLGRRYVYHIETLLRFFITSCDHSQDGRKKLRSPIDSMFIRYRRTIITKVVHDRWSRARVKGRVKSFIGDQKACRCLASKRRNKC